MTREVYMNGIGHDEGGERVRSAYGEHSHGWPQSRQRTTPRTSSA